MKSIKILLLATAIFFIASAASFAITVDLNSVPISSNLSQPEECFLDMSQAVVTFGFDGTTSTLYISNIQLLGQSFTINWILNLISGHWDIYGAGGEASGQGGLIDLSTAMAEFSGCVDMVIRDFRFLGLSFTACWSLDLNEGNWILAGVGDECPGVVNGQTSTVTIHVTDASTGNDLPGALILLSGTGQFSDTSGPDGIVTFQDVPYGAYDIEVTGPTGYVSSTRSVNIDEPTENYLIALSSILASGQIRIVLTWNEIPPDLDGHLDVPPDSAHPEGYHVGFLGIIVGNIIWDYGLQTSYPWATQDVDTYLPSELGGPETHTIHQLIPGTYTYYVHLWQDPLSADQFDESLVDTPLRNSGARVEVISGNTTIATYDIPTTGVGRIWYVFYMDGSTGSIMDINSIQQNLP